MTTAIPLTGNMVLKQEVLDFINIPKHRVELARIQSISEDGIKKQISKNSPTLTQFASLEYIRKAYGSLEACELLEPQKETV